MSRIAEVHARVRRQRLIAIIRATDRDDARDKARRALDAGIAALEVTMTTPGALDIVAELTRDHQDSAIGAGTVLDTRTARQAIDVGAQFLVSPHLSSDIVALACEEDAASYPGVGSVTEIVAGVRAGATALKLFPASHFGPHFVRDVLTALPTVELILTGGVTADNAAKWIAAGACGVGIGSELTSGDAAEVDRRVKRVLRALAGSV